VFSTKPVRSLRQWPRTAVNEIADLAWGDDEKRRNQHMVAVAVINGSSHD